LSNGESATFQNALARVTIRRTASFRPWLSIMFVRDNTLGFPSGGAKRLSNCSFEHGLNMD